MGDSDPPIVVCIQEQRGSLHIDEPFTPGSAGDVESIWCADMVPPRVVEDEARPREERGGAEDALLRTTPTVRVPTRGAGDEGRGCVGG